MKQPHLLVISSVAGLLAIAGLVSALSLSAKNRAAKAEISALQEQIVRMQAFVPDVENIPETIYLNESGNTNKTAMLRAKVAEQEGMLAELEMSTNRPPRESFEDRMARMKEEDPEGYAEMIKRREERQSQMRYTLAERTATLLDLDTSRMSAEERANHDLLVEKMARIWELTDVFNDPEAAPDRDAMAELFGMMRDVRPLLQTERALMLKQLGHDLGYEGEDAENFAIHVQNIIDATNLQFPRGGGRSSQRGEDSR